MASKQQRQDLIAAIKAGNLTQKDLEVNDKVIADLDAHARRICHAIGLNHPITRALVEAIYALEAVGIVISQESPS